MNHSSTREPRYAVAVAPGILNDGTYCVVIYDPEQAAREILVHGQLESKEAALRVASEYRNRCASPSFLIDREVEVRERTYASPLLLQDMSEQDLADALRDHVKEALSDLNEFKLSSLSRTPFVWTLVALIVYSLDWRLDVPGSVPFVEQILGSDKIGRFQLACVLPAALVVKYLVGRISMANYLAKEAMAAELVTTLACRHGWRADRFRDLQVGAFRSSRLRGLLQWFIKSMGTGELQRFQESMPREKTERTPFDFQQASFERYIHAMVFLREERGFSEQSFRIPSPIRLAGDFQVPQLEHRLSYLGERERRELRYRVHAAAERQQQRMMLVGWTVVTLPFLVAVIWSLWISTDAALWIVIANLLAVSLLVFWQFRRQWTTSAIPKELFRHELASISGMDFYYKLVRSVPRPNRSAKITTTAVVTHSGGPPR